MSKNYTGGLDFTWPLKNEDNWDDEADAALTEISAHDHTGGGNGAPVGLGGLANDSVRGTKILLANNEALRALNASAAAAELLKLSTTNVLELLQSVAFATTETLTGSGALSLTTSISVLNGASLVMTLAAGTGVGQLKLVLNIASTPATVTPSATTGCNIVSIGQFGWALYIYVNSEWRVLPGPVCNVTDALSSVQTFAAVGSWSGATNLVTCTGTTYTITTPAGYEGQTVIVSNQASGNVTFGGAVMATGTYYFYSYLNAGWRRVALA